MIAAAAGKLVVWQQELVRFMSVASKKIFSKKIESCV